MSRTGLVGGLVALVMSLGLSACGGSSHDKPKVKISDSKSAGSFCSEMARVACYNIFECCTGAQIEKTLGIKITTTEDECRRDAELLCQEAYYRQLDSLARGTVALDVDASTACLGAFVVQPDKCFPYATKIPWQEPCTSPFFVGKVEPGDDCIDTYECVTDSYCAPDKRCKAYATAGQSCAAARCASGLRCDTTAKCRALSKVNQSCTYPTDCEEGLYCERTAVSSTGEGACQPKLALGDPCSSGASCASSYCIPGLCVGITTTTGADKSCYKDTDCGAAKCASSGYSCTQDKDCGGKCSDSGYSCSSDSSCGTYGTCVFNKCQAAAVCQGQPVCGESHTKVDFCDGTAFLLGGTPVTDASQL